MSKRVPYATTLEVRDACWCLCAQRAARAVARRFDAELRAVGLTSGQFSLLMALNRPEPPPLGPVAQLLAMDRTTLTALLKPLVRAGLVTVQQRAEDRRQRLPSLTPEGHAALLAALPIWRRVQRRLDAELAIEAKRDARGALQSLAARAALP